LKAALLTHLDDSSAVAEDIGRQLLTYGRRMSPAELFARVDAVDAKAVKEACMKYVYDQEVSLAAIGPIESLPDLNRMRRLTYMLRY
jgi:processing peptidase subunit beta